MYKPNELVFIEWWNKVGQCYQIEVLTPEETSPIPTKPTRRERFSKWLGRLGKAAAYAIHR